MRKFKRKDHQKNKISKISLLHYSKLVFRTLLLLAFGTEYLVNRMNHIKRFPIVFAVIWLFFAVEMLLRFFPSKVESMGCQKQFARYYQQSTKNTVPKLQSAKATAIVAGFWLLLNGGIGVLYFFSILDTGMLILVSLLFSVCDMICILFFCPFQTWVMKNKCCVSCRIYNWDYAMMFTPLLFIPNGFTWSLLAIAIALLIKWEILYHRNPERFSETTNVSLSCANCEEKLCAHKKQLQGFLRKKYADLQEEVATRRVAFKSERCKYRK